MSKSFCAICTSEGLDLKEEKVDGKLVPVCARCRDEHPRDGGVFLWRERSGCHAVWSTRSVSRMPVGEKSEVEMLRRERDELVVVLYGLIITRKRDTPRDDAEKAFNNATEILKRYIQQDGK